MCQYQHKSGVNFRKIEKADLEHLLNLKKESWWGTHETSILNLKDQENWYQNTSDLCLIGEVYGDPIGIVIYSDFNWIARSATISGSVYPNKRRFSRRGFEAGLDFAFEMLNLHRVSAEVLESNYQAQFLEVSCLGMTVEGLKRQAVYKAGRYYNSLVLGILREDWLQQDRVIAMQGCCCFDFNHQKAEEFVQRSKERIQ